jgi:hypothetical protein
VTVPTLFSLFPKREDLLALTLEDLGGVIIEPPLLQNGLFNPATLTASLYSAVGPSYSPGTQRSVDLVIAEALSWLVTQGLLITDPGQPSPGFYVPTRRTQGLRTRADVDAFRKGRFLPDDLLPLYSPKRSSRCFVAATTTSECFKPSRRLKSRSGRHQTPRAPVTRIPR